MNPAIKVENITLESETFNQVVEEARRRAQHNPSWLRAINKAVAMLDMRPLLCWDGHELLVMSPMSFNLYRSNGSCRIEGFGRLPTPCPAHQRHLACWHRALARLIENYFEAVESSEMEAAA